MEAEICPRCHTFIFNRNTAELIRLNCKAYSCPVCGPRRGRRLWGAVTREVKSWKSTRMLTLTLSSSFTVDRYDHYCILTEAFRYFMQAIKRHFNEIKSSFKYIRVNEPHANGFCHMHILINRFVNIKTVVRLWQNCVLLVLKKNSISLDKFNFPDHITSAHIKLLPKKAAANYVCKYVVKSSGIKKEWRNLYSKSKIVVFFNSKPRSEKSQSPWIVAQSELQVLSLLVSLGELSQIFEKEITLSSNLFGDYYENPAYFSSALTM